MEKHDPRTDRLSSVRWTGAFILRERRRLDMPVAALRPPGRRQPVPAQASGTGSPTHHWVIVDVPRRQVEHKDTCPVEAWRFRGRKRTMCAGAFVCPVKVWSYDGVRGFQPDCSARLLLGPVMLTKAGFMGACGGSLKIEVRTACRDLNIIPIGHVPMVTRAFPPAEG